MKRHLILCSLAALLTMVACEKNENDTPDTPNPPDTEVVVNAFSVAPGHQVTIAIGNLQYQASTDSYRFAANGWEAAHNDNTNASANYDGWIDLFAWGTSGQDGYKPYSSNPYLNHDIAGTNYDWGVANTIINGTNTDPAESWRTPTSQEVDYIINTRTTSTVEGVENARYLLSMVDGHNGLLLFPDKFTLPEGVHIDDPSLINSLAQYSMNEFTIDEMSLLQEAGCVFLPALGCKGSPSGSLISDNYLACYWTSSYAGTGDVGNTAYQLWFNPNLCEIGTAGIQYPRAVRLVTDIIE